MEQVTFTLSGMTCGHCIATVQKALSGVDGVQVEQVSINRATVGFDASRTSAAAIAEILDETGYAVRSSVAA
jgi:copper chaperone